MDGIRTHIKVWKTCQKKKKLDRKYEKLPAKEEESIP